MEDTMTQPLPDFVSVRPSPERPLFGQTVLVVEDSRYAGEALRLMCLKSGARVRRAASLGAAQRHLATYRPSVAVVDLGLPDGSGALLLRDLHAARPRVHALLATSGDPERRDVALAAGADTFLEKPFGSLAAFQQAVLSHLPPEARPNAPRPAPQAEVRPDADALHDDLSHAANLLSVRDTRMTGYTAAFLAGLGRSARDPVLTEAARRLADSDGDEGRRTALAALVRDRLSRRDIASAGG
ncbi:response regulator [Tranquillimonas alkanivorans]|uniref:Response regulator receiver domain-containing protein n=1 Tax=Tranquillimonas alkanivorans TaxID=441119 RepID=A0A1I5TEK7_9RHOB|nr:response regulator [Tranquillimonas alkanivorans]SFP81495.1 Response regulator receiver domain-containing protein [Tranquillimonas alkanivorans]